MNGLKLTLDQVLERFEDTEIKVENDNIEALELVSNQHYNIVYLEIYLTNSITLGGYNNTINVGFMYRFLQKIFLPENEFTKISDVKNIPCRTIRTKDSKCIAIGHFMNDSFIILEDLINLNINTKGGTQ